MPIEPIDLDELIQKINDGKIVPDRALLEFTGDSNLKFEIFQDSGLNILRGAEGSGKTKLLTYCIHRFLDLISTKDSKLFGKKILLADTERPESQYAFSVKYIYDNTKMAPDLVSKSLHFLSCMELTNRQIMTAIKSLLDKYPDEKFIIIIDHILPLVNDMNNTVEATEVDRFLKLLILRGHIIITSIHKPHNGFLKGLGQLGSALDRQGAFTLEISNSEEGKGFDVRRYKSRISARSQNILHFTADDEGNIDMKFSPEIIVGPMKPPKKSKSVLSKEILQEFDSSIFNNKKELLSIIAQKVGFSESSSSNNTFFKENLDKLIEFKNGTYQISEEGNKLLNDESE